ncbi:MAG TPA: NAD(P)H-binding protein [Chryseolinea sp.]|nr:NAD(P)H-binding protein [Chryseolinea sp.]
MKIIVTGSLGHTGKPLANELVNRGHLVTVISSRPENRKSIEALGASPAIGSVEDISFLKGVFSGADAVFCMTPPKFSEPDQIRYYERIANCYAGAISHSPIKRVVYLSSYGAHLESGTGFITGSHKAEKILNNLANIDLTHIRPTYFYYNLLGFIQMIKSAGFIGTVYGGEDRLAMVSPSDIAFAVAEEITQVNNTAKVRYVTSDDRTCNEVALVLGRSIGITGLEWRILPGKKVMQSLLANGLSENAAMNLVELGSATHQGLLREDFDRNKPEFGKVSLEDFAQEFSAVYNQ